MKKIAFILVFLLSQKAFSQYRKVAIPADSTLERLMHEYKVPALAIGVIENGQVSHTKVLGELRKGIPAPPNAIFQVASLTKPITEMTTLRLVSKGLWDLDEPLFHYWTDPQVADDPRHRRLTTRHVISHQTGFVNWRWLHKSGKLTFDFEPGTQTQYSGEGLEYLKHALIKKFKLPFEEIVGKYLLKPDKMLDTRFYWDKGMDEGRFAVAHDRNGEPLPVKKYTQPSAADLLMTTIADYTLFGSNVLNKKELSDQAYSEMITFQDEKHTYGLGWQLFKGLKNDEFVITHSGADPGVRTIIILLPKSQRGIVIFTNGDAGMSLIKSILSRSLDLGDEIIERAK
ncbi:serine hydrolase domain-containing protein [Dyadobacter fermentans]|uniref:serine hydrolase domain-containing protein n=1 Tax=Dyadobacter fermentans TaxID=94254 RepID=UPI001CBE5DF1|nr:serine hydrolase domain-containing protein [Dyadobacter fermentans]MBZ1361631.1 beta-lactamase family protein [Dyadobacter fermentans]